MFPANIKLKKDVFNNLHFYLAKIKESILSADQNSRIYLFGSVVSGNYNMASDIDILIVTSVDRNIIQNALDKENLGFPFEFHIRTEETAEPYFRHVKEMILI
jgi:predicted nucleotidyltransferase